VVLACWHGGRIVAGGAVILPHLDNLELAYADVFTHPDRRRQGHGSAVIEAIVELARQHNRSRLFLEAMWALDDRTDAGHEFLLARGSTVDLIDAVRVLGSRASARCLIVRVCGAGPT
jgi:GNAT superfamily N-acetyltransferase